MKNLPLRNPPPPPPTAAARADAVPPTPAGLDLLTEEELMALRHEIDTRLKLSLAELNLAEELGAQFAAGKRLLQGISVDTSTPANQKAQVFNMVTSILDKILKEQKDIFSMQRLKRYETAFIKAMNTLPREAQEAFMDLYGEYLKEEGCQ